MANATPPAAQNYQQLKRFSMTLYLVLFAAVGVYWMVLEMEESARLLPQIRLGNLSLVKMILLLLAAADVLLVLYYRFSRLPGLFRDITAGTGMAQQISQLRACYILCFVLSEAVAVYGFFLRLLGGSRGDVIVFFVAAVALFLLCYPRMPAGLGGSHSSR